MLFDEVVARWALLVSFSAYAAVLFFQGLGLDTFANLAVFGTIYGLVHWVGRSKARFLRERRRHAETARARLAALMEAVPDVVVRADAEGHFLDLHAPAGAALPTSREELLASTVFDLVDPDVGERMRAAIDAALETGAPQHLAYSATYAGECHHFESRFVRSVPGEVLVVRQDVTTRVNEQRRALDLARLESLGARMNEVEFVFSPDGTLLHANDQALSVYGYTRDELIGRNVRDLRAPETVEQLDAQLALAGTEAVRFETVHVHKNGTRIPVEVSSSPVVVGGRKVLHTLAHDLTALKAAAHAVEVSEARLQRALGGSQDGYFELNLATGEVTRSPRVAEILGLEPDELGASAEDWTRRIHPDDAARFRESARNVTAGLVRTVDLEYRVVAASGQYKWVRTRAQRYESPGGGPPTLSGVLTDVTAQHEERAWLEAALEQNGHLLDDLRVATLEALRANELKGQFLANMSHEIRTPLNAVIGLSALAREEGDPARRSEYLASIHEAGESLLGLVNDILDVAKIEAGKLTIERVPFELPRLVQQVVDLFEASAEARGLTLTCTVAADAPRIVMGDPLRTRQVLSNLLSNAIKFTEVGGVRVELARGAAELAVIRVADSGVGMTFEQQQGLFNAFAQADSSTTRRFGGTGLGLAISRSLARAMSGNLDVASRPGEGSTFTFSFSAPPATDADRQALEARRHLAPQLIPDLGGNRVLLAEDNRINQVLARRLLQKTGLDVTVVDDGRKAVEAVCRTASRFDLVLMDVQMPVLDGLEATRAIRRALGSAAPPIVAMTANAMPEQRAESLAAGMVAHLSKPIDVAELYRTLSALLGPEAARSVG